MPRNCARWDSPARHIVDLPAEGAGLLAWVGFWSSCPVTTCQCHGAADLLRSERDDDARLVELARTVVGS